MIATKQGAVEKKANLSHLNQRELIADALLFYLQFGDLEPDERKVLARIARQRSRQMRVFEVEIVQIGDFQHLRQV